MNVKRAVWTWIMACLFFGAPKPLSADSTPEIARPTTTEHWTLGYKKLRESVLKIQDQVGRNYFPELMIIKDGSTIASIPVDVFAAKVLKEADEVLFPYREAIQLCVEQNQNEFRVAKVHSFEYFGWFLDNYVRTLGKALESQGEAEVRNGVKERKVTTDRALYAFTKLLNAYLEERVDRYKNLDAPSYAADKALISSITDIGRRVFRIDLNQKFDRRELVEKGMKSQPVLRDLASPEGGADLSLGLDPVSRLIADSHTEPLCKISLPPRGDQVANSQ